MVAISAVESALRPISGALEADGYRLAVSTPRADQLRVEILAGPEACEDCLIPKPMFERMLETALSNAGLSNFPLELIYPDQSHGTTT